MVLKTVDKIIITRLGPNSSRRAYTESNGTTLLLIDIEKDGLSHGIGFGKNSNILSNLILFSNLFY